MDTNNSTTANDPPVVPIAPSNSIELPELEVFRVGEHQTSSGERLSFSAADLAATAAAYDPVAAPAPIVVGHPKTDAPAYGWATGFKVNGNKLVADPPTQTDPQFAALVRDGKFKRISLALFRPNDPSNPKPGVWYPRHIGFLGAAAPAIPGLKPVAFASDRGYVEFSADTSARWTIARTMQRLRDFLIEQFSVADADKVLSDYDVASAIESATRADEEANRAREAVSNAPNFTAPNPALTDPDPKIEETNEMSEQDKARLAQLEKENAELKAAQQTAALAARRTEFTALVESLKAAGKLPAALTEGLVEFAMGLPDDASVEFAAADGTQTKTPSLAWLKQFLNGLPVSVPLGEVAPAAVEVPQTIEFTAPAGATVDKDRAALLAKAMAYQAEHKCDDLTALRAVGA